MSFKGVAISGGKDDRQVFSFRCANCSELHEGSPSFGYDRPFFVDAIPEEQRGERVELDDDTCVIDGETYFIRALLEIPIVGVEDPFLWGVWVSQSAESFKRYRDTFGQDQSGDGSFGWLAVTMPGYVGAKPGAEIASLACDVRWRGDGQRPTLGLHETDHPLYEDFSKGITWDRAVELAVLNLHRADRHSK